MNKLRRMKYGIALLNPKQWLLLALVYNLVALACTIGVAIQQPWLGLKLHTRGTDAIYISASGGPSASLPPGATLTAIGTRDGGSWFVLQAQDLMEEPDVVSQYHEMETFFARQQSG